MNELQQVELRELDESFTLTNRGKETLRFSVLEEHGAGAPPCELDPTRLDDQKNPMPKLYGPPNNPSKQYVKQFREHKIELAPGAKIKMPTRLLHGVVRLRCSDCEGKPKNRSGRASLECLRDHRDKVSIFGCPIVFDVTKVEINILADVPLDPTYQKLIELDATSGPHNNYGFPKKPWEKT